MRLLKEALEKHNRTQREPSEAVKEQENKIAEASSVPTVKISQEKEKIAIATPIRSQPSETDAMQVTPELQSRLEDQISPAIVEAPPAQHPSEHSIEKK